MSESKPIIAAAPDYHYHRPPYSILSFLYGLYCDEAWSKKEYDKWEASEVGESGHYLYDKYLEPYAEMTLQAANLISKEVPKNELPRGQEEEAKLRQLRGALAAPSGGAI